MNQQTPPLGYLPPPRPPAPQGTSGFAIASLICSLAGLPFCGLPAILGIIFGGVALSQLKTEPRPGRGLAIAGILVGVFAIIVWTVLWIVAVRFGESCISIGSTRC